MTAMHDPGRRVAHVIIDMAASSLAAADMGLVGADGLAMAGNHALDEHGVKQLMETGQLSVSDTFMPPAILVELLVMRLEDLGASRDEVLGDLRATIDGT